MILKEKKKLKAGVSHYSVTELQNSSTDKNKVTKGSGSTKLLDLQVSVLVMLFLDRSKLKQLHLNHSVTGLVGSHSTYTTVLSISLSILIHSYFFFLSTE